MWKDKVLAYESQIIDDLKGLLARTRSLART